MTAATPSPIPDLPERVADLLGLELDRAEALVQEVRRLYESRLTKRFGHMLEAVAKACHPEATVPLYPDDFDYEVTAADGAVDGYQVKLSFDCMPMSTRKNLSATVRQVRDTYRQADVEFRGHFAPCYGKATTTTPRGQDYISLGSRDFWTRVGGGDRDFDLKVSAATTLICSDFRARLEIDLVPRLIEGLTAEALVRIGTPEGDIDIQRLFRAINP